MIGNDTYTAADAIIDYLKHYTGNRFCSKQLYWEAFGYKGDACPSRNDLNEINKMVNRMIVMGALDGWKRFESPKRFALYGTQKGWEKIEPKPRRKHLPHVERKRQYQELKKPCAKCGETRAYLIQFHHIDPQTKQFTVGASHKPLEEIKVEAKKCVCLCANCHTEFHHFYGRNPENPRQALKVYLGGLNETHQRI